MENSGLIKIKTYSKRVGRGYGSGRGGHTVGRGTKGQKARSKVGILFEGMKSKKSLLRRLPFLRGKGRLKSKGDAVTIQLEDLNVYKAGSVVNLDTLEMNGIVAKSVARKHGVKIVSGGELKNKLIIQVPISKSAADAVVKLGGEVEKEVEIKARKGKSKSKD